jgi:YVTN family beta-propeller protein
MQGHEEWFETFAAGACGRRTARVAAAAWAFSGLLACMPTLAQPWAYVISSATQQLDVIDAATDAVAASVPVGASPVALAVTPDGARVFVANGGSASVTVVDGENHAPLATLPLPSAPSAIAASPDGTRLYVMLAGGLVQAVDAASGAALGSVSLAGGEGLAVSPDGSRLYVAAGGLQVIDTATMSLSASVALGADQWAHEVVLSADGKRAWVTHHTGLFSGGVALIDTAALAVQHEIALGSLPGRIALAPDGSRAYVGIQATWVDTGYGAGFFPGRTVVVIDALLPAIVAAIDLGADGSNWTQQNTASGIAVTPDRASVFISVPRLGRVAAAGVNLNAVRTLIPLSSPGAAAAARLGTPLLPYVVDAVDDIAPATTLGGTVLANVLANDRFGGIAPATRHMRLQQLSATHPGLTLNTRSGAVKAAAGMPIGSYRLAYRSCERASLQNCDDAQVHVSVTTPLPITAADDAATAYPNTPYAGNVLSNDTLGGAAATSANTRIKLLSSSHTGLTLNTASGAVSVAAGTPLGPQRLHYRLCEAAVSANCDTATMAVTVIARPVAASDDDVLAPRTGGRVLAGVRGNDTLAGLPATALNTAVTMTSTSNPGVTLDAADGSINVATGTAVGLHTVGYRLCEAASLSNCDDAEVRVTVQPYVVDAGDDSARASSKVASTALASVLWNDRFAGRAATAADVTMQQVSLTPANPQIRLDTTDGSVDILGKTQSGEYRLVYRLCERADPNNCDGATVLLDLSGGG